MTAPSPSTAELRSMAADPATFRQRLLVDTDNGPRPLAEVADPWQAADFAALDSGWMRAAGLPVDGDCFGRAYLERGRGHSKTSDLATMSTWALFASRRRLSGVAAAADKDQARLLRDACHKLVGMNPWLGQFLDVQNYRIVNKHTESTLEVIAADAPSSYGLTPDFVVADELTHWPADDLWTALFSAAAKRKHCLFLIISNAGLNVGDCWQWTVREAARESAGWYFSRIDGPQASWISPTALDEQRRMLPPSAYARLWLNQWQAGAGDAFDEGDIEAALTCEGPMEGPADGYFFAGAIDVGLKRDHTGFAIIGAHPDSGRTRLAHVESWRPPEGGSTNFDAITDRALELSAQFGINFWAFDSWQAAHLGQTLERYGFAVEVVQQTGKVLVKQATCLLSALRDRTIDLYPDPALLRDLRSASIIEASYGMRLTSPRNKHGHGDRLSALAIGLPYAFEAAALAIVEPVEYVSGYVGMDRSQHYF